MSAIFCPPGGSSANFAVLDSHVCVLANEKLDHRLMAVKRRIVQTRAGIVKASRNDVDLCALSQEKLCCRNVAVHASIDEGIVENALAIIRPRGELCRQLLLAGVVEVRAVNDLKVSPGPVDYAGFRLQSAVVIEKTFDAIRVPKAGGDTQVVNGCTTPEQQIYHLSAIPVECLL